MPQTTTKGGAFSLVTATLALALLGYVLLPQLSVRWQPAVLTGKVRIAYAWPNADPLSIEQQITAPLEAAMALLREVETINSVSSSGRGVVELQLKSSVDTDFARFQIAAQIRRLYPRLPLGVSYPTISLSGGGEDNEADSPVLIYVLSGPEEASEIYRYASEELSPQLGLLAGLQRLEISGGNQLHWRLEIDTEKAALLGFSREAILQRLRAYIDRQGLGSLDAADGQRFAYLREAPRLTQDISWENILLPAQGERQIRLGELATIELVPLAPTRYFRVDGRNSIRLLAYPSPTANQIALAADFKARIAQISEQIPPSYRLHLEEDATAYLRSELAKTRFRTLLSMGILLPFILVAYRSFRRLWVISLSLVANLGLAFLAYYLLGVELNLYAFAGIAISFGIMIDNVIIMLDELQHSQRASPVAPAIVGATLTTMASLSVIWFLGEELRQQLFELARVMSINLLTSLLVALFFVPALEALVGQPAASGDRPRLIARSRWRWRVFHFFYRSHQALLNGMLRWRKTSLLAVILLFGLPVFWLPARVSGWEWYNKSIGHEYYQEHIRPHVNRWLGGTFRLFSYYVFETSGYRKAQETKLYVSAELPDGASIHQLSEVFSQVEGFLQSKGYEHIRYTTQVFSGQVGRMEIRFLPAASRALPYMMESDLIGFAVNFGGITWSVRGVGDGYSNNRFGSLGRFRVKMKGYDLKTLQQQADRLAELLLDHPRVEEVNTDAHFDWTARDRSEWIIHPLPEAMALQGQTMRSLQQALNWFNQAEYPDLLLDNGRPLLLRPQNAAAYDRWRLENWAIPSNQGAFYFASLADLEKRQAAQSLYKEDQQYLQLVEFDYLGSPRFGSEHLDRCLATLAKELPMGFTAERLGQSRESEAKRWVGLLLLATILIFFICALLFESLWQATNILLLIPVSFIGIFITFYAFNVRLDQGGYTAFLLVAGLVVNGLILIINTYNALRKSRPAWTAQQCYLRAFYRKITPILLTTISTAVGLLPFLLGGRKEIFWHSLAAGTIGGLLFSLLVLALVSPIFYAKAGK